MEYNKLIAEMSLSDEVEGFYVLKAAYPKTTATGKPFLSASLSDRSGSIEIKVWDYSGPISSADEGNVVKWHCLRVQRHPADYCRSDPFG